MTREEFQTIISQDPALAGPLKKAAGAVQSQRFGILGEAALIAFMLPIARFILKDIGLPWLCDAGRYAKLWQLKFERWVDTQYQKHGFDPDKAETAGNALRKELEQITDKAARASWEQVSKQFGESSGDEG